MPDNLSGSEERNYRYALEALFGQLRKSAYVFAARWSQLETARNPLLFCPGAVGDMNPRRITSLENHFNKDDLLQALNDFSFTKLLVENDREVWFHFSRPDPEEHPTLDEQVYLRPLKTDFKEAQIILVDAERASDYLVERIIELFERGEAPMTNAQHRAPIGDEEYVTLLCQVPRNPVARGRLISEIVQRGINFEVTPGLRRLTANKTENDELLLRTLEEANRRRHPATYGHRPLAGKIEAIKKTLELAIFSIFDDPECEVNHIYFVPVDFPSGNKKIAGIFSFYTADRLNAVSELLPIFQPFAQGIMAPHHFREIEEQRRRFSLRTAIAAIMSRNISHNIGSHVLWHLSQELKS
ncbi:MAG: hypothetical protein ACXWID_01600 [Pyrinomonadaceae bacterium]